MEKARWEAKAGQRTTKMVLYFIFGVLLIIGGLAAAVALFAVLADVITIGGAVGNILKMIVFLSPIVPLYLGWEFVKKDADTIDPLIALKPAPPEVKEDNFLILDSYDNLIKYCIEATISELKKSWQQKKPYTATSNKPNSKTAAWFERVLSELSPSRHLTLGEVKKIYKFGFSRQLNHRFAAIDVDNVTDETHQHD